MTVLNSLYIILLILGIMFTGLTLYFDYRVEKLNKRYEQKNARTTKKRPR